jgi:hypothetical protein
MDFWRGASSIRLDGVWQVPHGQHAVSEAIDSNRFHGTSTHQCRYIISAIAFTMTSQFVMILLFMLCERKKLERAC